MCENERSSIRSSIRQLKNSSVVKGIRKRLESFGIDQIKPEPPKKNVVIRRHTLKDSSTLEHRKGLIIPNTQPDGARLENPPQETSEDGNENIKNSSFVHKQFRQVLPAILSVSRIVLYVYFSW